MAIIMNSNINGGLNPVLIDKTEINNNNSVNLTYNADGTEKSNLLITGYGNNRYVSGSTLTVLLNGNDITNDGVLLYPSTSEISAVEKSMIFNIKLKLGDILTVTNVFTNQQSYLGIELIGL